MKKIYFPMLLTMILVTSCKMNPKAGPVNLSTAKDEINRTMDSMNNAVKAKDLKTFFSFLTEDGLFCGTDPNEILDKAAYSKLMDKMLTDTTHFDMKIDKQDIRVDQNGKSAIAYQQFVTEWSKPIMLRSTMHFIRMDKRWMVDYSSLGLVPENKDLAKIIAVR